MPNPWNGYAAVNDDLRHTWERAAYGRPVTGDLTETDVPGMADAPAPKKETPEPSPAPAGSPSASDLYGEHLTHEERQGAAYAYAHAENAPGIRREIEQSGPDSRPYQAADAPALEARGSASREVLYGEPPAWLSQAGSPSEAHDLHAAWIEGSPSLGTHEEQQSFIAGVKENQASDLYGLELDADHGSVWGQETAGSSPMASRADLYGQEMEPAGSVSREALYGTTPNGGATADDLYGRAPGNGPEAPRPESLYGTAPSGGATAADLYGQRPADGTEAARPEPTHADLYGQGRGAQDADTGNVWGPARQDAPAASQPSEGNDMTPG